MNSFYSLHDKLLDDTCNAIANGIHLSSKPCKSLAEKWLENYAQLSPKITRSRAVRAQLKKDYREILQSMREVVGE
jgi:hypothetical protein